MVLHRDYTDVFTSVPTRRSIRYHGDLRSKCSMCLKNTADSQTTFRKYQINDQRVNFHAERHDEYNYDENHFSDLVCRRMNIIPSRKTLEIQNKNSIFTKQKSATKSVSSERVELNYSRNQRVLRRSLNFRSRVFHLQFRVLCFEHNEDDMKMMRVIKASSLLRVKISREATDRH